MHDDYYQSILYPRFSDDLDFFLNNSSSFKSQVKTVINTLKEYEVSFETAVADEGYARLFVFQGEHALKLDFVNDVSFRCGAPEPTKLFARTDNLYNILSNKISALGRYSPKDVVDIVYISEFLTFNWESILNDAAEKDLWVNPISAAEVLEQFPVEKLHEIAWSGEAPSTDWFAQRLNQIIAGILDGSINNVTR